MVSAVLTACSCVPPSEVLIEFAYEWISVSVAMVQWNAHSILKSSSFSN